jgi:hypothetical protein
MRLVLRSGVLSIALLLVVAAVAWSSKPQVNTYSGTSSRGGRVHFRTDTKTAHNFKLEGRPLFNRARIKRHVTVNGNVVWRFHLHNRHWRVHGHWVGRTTVHGSICNLSASPDGCPNAEHLQTYVAQAKSRR